MEENIQWELLSKEEKNKQLFLKQKKLLETFLEHGAIDQQQFEFSLKNLAVKMGMEDFIKN